MVPGTWVRRWGIVQGGLKSRKPISGRGLNRNLNKEEIQTGEKGKVPAWGLYILNGTRYVEFLFI